MLVGPSEEAFCAWRLLVFVLLTSGPRPLCTLFAFDQMDDHLRNLDILGQANDACKVGVTRSCINEEAVAKTRAYPQSYLHPCRPHVFCPVWRFGLPADHLHQKDQHDWATEFQALHETHA